MAVASGTFAYGTLNIGLGSTNAHVVLVNNFKNDNPVVAGDDSDKYGEKLIVDSLNIAADSILNVNGQAVQIASSLDMESSAVIDLNIQEEVSVGTEIKTFYGDGNQSAEWSMFEDQVVNGNETTGFSAVYNATDDKTYWKVSSAGGGTVLIIQ